ncbi:MAG: winged helix-turn-helix domain-containing protein [Candidatus Eremiobacteraeota bacterium]|nr:winged helix-turn-helix domain-containing protein [Candidatus Eremiobacteraeota bacterium]MBV8498242.1 winged helix-turn-helix domain-containing protein [Candidatus Eremiobacteraeota bacterium]
MAVFRFGKYRLDVDRRLLVGGDRVVPLSAKTFDVLHCMLRAAGRTVSKEELISEVWQHEPASDATIVQHVWMLRRALDEGAKSHNYILTIPRKGYRFVSAVKAERALGQTAEAIALGEPSRRGEPPVWREYLTGIQYANRRDRSSLNLAMRHFKAALVLDPMFAPAWLGVAGVSSGLAYYAFVTWESVLPTALAATAKAIDLDRSSAMAHCLLSQLRLVQWDVGEAQRSLDRAGNLDAGSAAVYQLASFIAAWRGDSNAALTNARRAVGLAPTDIACHGQFANALAIAGDFANAIASYSEILQIQPSCVIARQGRCEAYAADGRLDLAMNDLDQLPRTPANLARRACVQAYMGDRLGASRLLRELYGRSASQNVQPHCLAQVHVALGRPDEAVRLTQRAIATNDVVFPAMLTSPLLHAPMRERRARQMLGDVSDTLCRPHKKIG